MAAASSSLSTSTVTEEELTLIVKWSGKEYTVRVCGDDSVGELKRRICELTNVLPKRQKLLYPKIGNKLADDSVLLSQLPLKSSLKMTMIGFHSLHFLFNYYYYYYCYYYNWGSMYRLHFFFFLTILRLKICCILSVCYFSFQFLPQLTIFWIWIKDFW